MTDNTVHEDREIFKRDPNPSQEFELRLLFRLIGTEVGGHPPWADHGGVPVGRITGDGGEAVVADGPEDDVYFDRLHQLESRDRSGDRVALGVLRIQIEPTSGQEPLHHFVARQCNLDRRNRLLDRKWPIVVHRKYQSNPDRHPVRMHPPSSDVRMPRGTSDCKDQDDQEEESSRTVHCSRELPDLGATIF